MIHIVDSNHLLKIVDYLLSSGADPTLQNDNGENALKVAPPQIRSRLLGNHVNLAIIAMGQLYRLAHVAKDRPSTAQQLLQAAWLGDAVTVKKNLVCKTYTMLCSYFNYNGIVVVHANSRSIH